MGCCATNRPQSNLTQQRPPKTQPRAYNINLNMATSPELFNPDHKNDHLQPRQPPYNSKNLILVRTQQGKGNSPYANKYGRNGWIGSQDRQEHKHQRKAVEQSPTTAAFSAEAKGKLLRLNSKQGADNFKQLYAADPITEVPSSMDSKKKSANHSQIALQDNSKPTDNVSPRLFHENQRIMAQLGNGNDMLSHGEHLNRSRLKLIEKAHGEEQVLQSFDQHFQIPIFEVALAAHS